MKLTLPDNLVASNIDTDLIERVISIINTGRAILFTGAGFSFGCENVLKKTPPRAKGLTKLISQKGGFEEDDDLTYVADYFLNYKNRYDLLHIILPKIWTTN